jgi:hypothetical protein
VLGAWSAAGGDTGCWSTRTGRRCGGSFGGPPSRWRHRPDSCSTCRLGVTARSLRCRDVEARRFPWLRPWGVAACSDTSTMACQGLLRFGGGGGGCRRVTLVATRRHRGDGEAFGRVFARSHLRTSGRRNVIRPIGLSRRPHTTHRSRCSVADLGKTDDTEPSPPTEGGGKRVGQWWFATGAGSSLEHRTVMWRLVSTERAGPRPTDRAPGGERSHAAAR